MKKRLIGTHNLEEWLCPTSGKVYMDGTTIMTAAARDELSRRGIDVVQGAAPGAPSPSRGEAAHGENASSDLERLLLGVAAILRDHYGVTDPGELKQLSLHVARIVKKHL
jgi:hypothetical protein